MFLDGWDSFLLKTGHVVKCATLKITIEFTQNPQIFRQKPTLDIGMKRKKFITLKKLFSKSWNASENKLYVPFLLTTSIF